MVGAPLSPQGQPWPRPGEEAAPRLGHPLHQRPPPQPKGLTQPGSVGSRPPPNSAEPAHSSLVSQPPMRERERLAPLLQPEQGARPRWAGPTMRLGEGMCSQPRSPWDCPWPGHTRTFVTAAPRFRHTRRRQPAEGGTPATRGLGEMSICSPHQRAKGQQTRPPGPCGEHGLRHRPGALPTLQMSGENPLRADWLTRPAAVRDLTPHTPCGWPPQRRAGALSAA